MKIFNYSDLPVVIRGVPIEDTVIHLPDSIERWHVQHNGVDFIPSSTDQRNVHLTIHQRGTVGEYKYNTEIFDVPDVTNFVLLFIAFFGFMMLTRLIQKLKLR